MKYQELRTLIGEMIANEEGYDENGKFLSERELSAKYNVSRSLVRRAIADLQKQGCLISISGKGTFVKGMDRTQSIYSIIRCAENYKEIGLHPSNQILEKKIVPATERIAGILKMKIGEMVLHLDKLYLADRMILNETYSYLPLNCFPNLEKCDFVNIPIIEIMRTKYSVRPRRTKNTIEAVLPTSQIAENMKIAEKTPLILR